MTVTLFKTTQLPVTDTIAASGVDTYVPTEKAVRDALDSISLGNPVALSSKAYRTSTQTISNNTYTAVALNGEQWDNDTIHDNSTNNERLTCKTAGIYVVTGMVRWDTSVTGIRLIQIRKTSGGSTTYPASTQGSSTGYYQQSVTAIVNLAVNDYVELWVYQDSGGDLNLYYAADMPAALAMVRVGPES